uniref:Immunoglobulin domain-containing protein n=1 Tax=Gopherus evgoodei TaxID=1825980 RepID=A0A8C4WAD2_9SAUR
SSQNNCLKSSSDTESTIHTSLNLQVIHASCCRGRQDNEGPLGGVLTVQCWYSRGYENYIKYWCRGTTSTSCLIIETTGSETEVKRGRVSIRDNHTLSTFTVTMENLTLADASMYHCGVDRTLLPDSRATVELTVSEGKSLRCPPAVPGLPGLGQSWGAVGVWGALAGRERGSAP